MQHVLLVQAQRQIAVAVQLHAEDEHVRRAVHRLEAEALLLGLDLEHVVGVVLPVARGLPQLLVEEQRRLDLDVAGLVERAARRMKLGERVVEDGALGSQNGAPGAHGWNANRPELLAELAVIALLRLLELLEVARRAAFLSGKAVP